VIRLTRRVEVTLPTPAGWVAGGAVFFIAAFIFTCSIHPFLAVSRPNGSGSLVVEGWLTRGAVLETVEVTESRGYDRIYTTGGPIPAGSYLSELYPDLTTFADIAAHQLREAGVPDHRVVVVPRKYVSSHRTYFSALALRRHLTDEGLEGSRLDIRTAGPHARRSWLLFGLALDGVAEVGVEAIRPDSYDPDRWWASSSGVRTVIGEGIAYFYAKFFFYPNVDEDVTRIVHDPKN
jgi:hypothetical protein